MLISIVICCHNSEARLTHCLRKIISALTDLKSMNTEVIVVDNASDDNTKNIALNLFPTNSHNYYLISEVNKGLMNARLAGINASKGDIICFLDDDNWVSVDYFNCVYTVFSEHENVGFFGCSSRLPKGISFPEEIRDFAKQYAVGDRYQKTGFLNAGQEVWGAGFAARSSILKNIFNSGFSPILTGRTGTIQMAGDDSELCFAINITGWQGWYQCTPLLEHAIDIKRMNVSVLKNMSRGFGASNSIITRYIMCARGQTRIALNFFSIWYIIKIAKNLLIQIYYILKFGLKTDTKLSFIFYYEAFKYYFFSKKKCTQQKQNIKILFLLRDNKKNIISE